MNTKLKITLITVGLGTLAILSGCKENSAIPVRVTDPVPVPSVAPEMVPKPEVAPPVTKNIAESTIPPAPAKPIILEGQKQDTAPIEQNTDYYVVKTFNVEVDGNLFGFPVGQKVQVIKKTGEIFTVSNGKATVDQSFDFFTNDPNLIEQLFKNKQLTAQTVTQIRAKQAEIQKVNAEKAAADKIAFEKDRAASQKTQKIANLTASIEATKAKIAELNAILKKNYVYNGPNKTGWSSADDQVRLRDVAALKAQLPAMEAELLRESK